ncbi:MAG: efflux RND transporter periplasmic adaptor subunit [Pseudomonadota bacterium]
MNRLAACLATAALCSGLVANAAAQEVVEEVIRPVKLVELQANGNGVERHFFGHVVARQTVDLAFQVGGQVIEFPAIEGEEIGEGDLIAQLDLEPFLLQRDQARVQLEQAERTLDRFDQLSDLAVSQATIDDTQTQVDLARIALRDAEYALEHATLYAPFDGLVAVRNVANFTTIGVGSPVVRFHDMSELRIEIDVPEILFQQAGQDPDVTLTAQFPASDTVFPLELREFDAQASSVGQTFRLTLGLPRPNGLAILPGSSVEVTARLDSGQDLLILPTSAIGLSNDGDAFAMVFLPTEDDQGTLEQRSIDIAPTREGRFHVLSGLEAGDLVVVTGVGEVDDAQTVRRFAGFAN